MIHLFMYAHTDIDINIGKPKDICYTKKLKFSSKFKTIKNICLKERSKIQVDAKHCCELNLFEINSIVHFSASLAELA